MILNNRVLKNRTFKFLGVFLVCRVVRYLRQFLNSEIMGNDGGTIPTRIELVKEKRRAKKADKDDVTAAKWKYCQISQEPLRCPIVACDLGRLYNKDAVLEHLLKKRISPVAQHIKTLKDVTELHLTESARLSSTAPVDPQKEITWVCPITGLEMAGLQHFSFIKDCGCVFSDRALKALKSTQDNCPACGKLYNPENVISINPGPEETQRLKFRLDLLKSQQKKDKLKSKDEKKRSAEVTEGQSSSKKHSSAVAAKNHSLSTDDKVKEISMKSVADDPNASKVFRSLFTTSSAAQKQGHAHWVTHNPYYN